MIVNRRGNGGQNRFPQERAVLAIYSFGLGKQRTKVPPDQFLRGIAKELGECGVARPEFSLQISGKNCHLRRHCVRGAICCAGKGLLLIRTVVRSRHMSAFGMMVTQAGHLDREACYEGRNQGNVGLMSWLAEICTLRNPETGPKMTVPLLFAFRHEQTRHLVTAGVGVRLQVVGHEHLPHGEEPSAAGGRKLLKESAPPGGKIDALEAAQFEAVGQRDRMGGL